MADLVRNSVIEGLAVAVDRTVRVPAPVEHAANRLSLMRRVLVDDVSKELT